MTSRFRVLSRKREMSHWHSAIRRPLPGLSCEVLEDRRVLAVFFVSADVPDGAEGSLRHAVDLAKQNSESDTIELTAGTHQLTLLGFGEDENSTGDLDLRDSHALTLQGRGDGETIIDASDLGDRAIEVHSGANLTIDGITIQGGSNVDAGGGIENRGTLVVRDSTLRQNQSGYQGGAINNRGSLNVFNSRFLDNYADYEGGGIELNYPGSALITNSYFARNTSGYEGGAISVGTVTRGRVDLSLTDSTLANNSADYSGGGIDIDGQAVVEVINTTISGNHARYEGGGIAVTGRLELLNTTITNNSSSHGAAVNVSTAVRFGAAAARNSIVHGGISGENRFTDLGHNLINVDPQLRPLADNGGPTPTHALLPRSPAIDAGDNADAPPMDQRGFPRITDGDGDGAATIDIGAFEALRLPSFTVNSERDAVDQTPGNGIVDTGVEGEITLRAAIMEVNASAERARINLPEGTYSLARDADDADEVDDTLGDLDIRSDIDIVGAGAEHTIVDASASAAGFEVHDLARLFLEGITVRDARHDGGIVNRGNLLVQRSHILNNAGSPVGGGIANLGGNATIRETYIALNKTGTAGGGIYSRAGSLIIEASTLYQNTSGARGEGGGVLIHGGEAIISNSTISYNSSGAGGTGGGIFVRSGDISVHASTIYQNETTAGGFGGGIYNADGSVELTSSIVARNRIGDLAGVILLNGFNFIGDDPYLGPLSDNGGPTPTHLPAPHSPVLDQGNAAVDRTDQRGEPRVVDLPIPNAPNGDGSDIGAVELQNAAPQLAPGDFNNDNQLDCADVDALVAATLVGNNPPEFDLTGDNAVDKTDLDAWLALAGSTNLVSGAAYLPGDSDLNGRVDALDLNEFALNWRQDATGWCPGDFTADGRVDAFDLNMLSLNWHKDVSRQAAATRAPRAPLANRVVTAIAAASRESTVLTAASVFKPSPGSMNEQTATATVSSSSLHNRYVRLGLRSSSTHIDSEAKSFLNTQGNEQEQLVDWVLRRWQQPKLEGLSYATPKRLPV